MTPARPYTVEDWAKDAASVLAEVEQPVAVAASAEKHSRLVEVLRRWMVLSGNGMVRCEAEASKPDLLVYPKALSVDLTSFKFK